MALWLLVYDSVGPYGQGSLIPTHPVDPAVMVGAFRPIPLSTSGCGNTRKSPLRQASRVVFATRSGEMTSAAVMMDRAASCSVASDDWQSSSAVRCRLP